MRELALFAGAGGGILGGRLLGWRTVCAVELDPYARNVLVARQNDGSLRSFPIWDDVHTFDGRPWCGAVDVVSGGFPCQFASSAARGRNTAPNLWPHMFRIVSEVRPRFVLTENVSLSLVAKRQARADLERIGYRVRGPIKVRADDIGAPHRRERLWMLGYTDRDGESVGAEYGEMAGLSESASDVRRDWPDAPDAVRVDDGLAYRVDRLTAIGNGQVPRVAATAWRLLRKVTRQHVERPPTAQQPKSASRPRET